MIIAYEHTQNYVGTEHLLIGILDQNEPKINKILKDAGVDMDQLEEAIDAALHKTGDAQIADEIRIVAEEFGELENTKQTPAQTGKQPDKDSSSKKSAPRQPTALDVFTSDLTNKSFQETLDPVIGREDEITRLIRILARRTKK
jgi:ATP-dependent Clp protease ATP-binding subunit ClpA